MSLSAGKSLAIQQLIDDLIEFSSASMQWCASASEDATKQIVSILGHLTDEAARVASMSTEALAAVEAIRKSAHSAEEGKVANGLIVGLKQLTADHNEVGAFVDPIVQALQFQDRVTQMMENMVRMIAAWAIERERVEKKGGLDLVAFGSGLLKATTAAEERDRIRALIPGLPPEEVVDAVNLF